MIRFSAQFFPPVVRRYCAAAARRLKARRALRAQALALLLVLAAAGGYGAALLQAPGDYPGAAAALRAYLGDLEEIRRSREIESSLLIRKVAALSARLARIEALGNRITEDYGMDSAEFNFPDAPGIGGITPSPAPAAVASLEAGVRSSELKLSLIEDHIRTHDLSEDMVPFGWPVKRALISSGYGMRLSPFSGKREFHAGIDIVGRVGDPVRSLASGVVQRTADLPHYGKLVEISHADGYATRYAHNSEIVVAEGDVVKKGQVIAKLGNTGRSTGPHLHLEILKDSRRLNPRPFLRGSRR